MPSRSRIDAVDHQAGALGRLHHVVEQVVADDGAALGLAEEIDHQNVARLQHVDRDLVVHAVEAGGLGLGVDHRVEVGAHRHELHGERPADQLLVRMEDLEAIFVLVPESLARQDREDLFGRQPAGALDQPVRHLRPAVGKPVERVVAGPRSHLLFREVEQLRACEQRRAGLLPPPSRAQSCRRFHANAPWQSRNLATSEPRHPRWRRRPASSRGCSRR